MDIARSLALSGAANGTTVVAKAQTSGRGRLGRNWFSPAGAGLWTTTLLYPTKPASELSQLGIVAGIATLGSLHTLNVQGVKLKWPNDLMVEKRKLAGILLEAHNLDSEKPFVLIGIGINVQSATQLELPGDIGDRYIGLSEITPTANPAELYETCLRNLVSSLESHYQSWSQEGLSKILPFWNEHDWLAGQRVQARAEAGVIEGIARGINQSGELTVETKEGICRIRSGEVQRIQLS